MHDFDVEAFLRESVETIWEHKMLGHILEIYAPAALIHIGADAPLHGGRQFLDHTVRFLAAFPDLRVFVDDVIWARRATAYLTAVRWTAVARHTGSSCYGAATGRRVVVTGIVASRIERGQFVEQWIEWGDGDLARQLGVDVRAALQRRSPEGAATDFDRALDLGPVEGPTAKTRTGRPLESGGEEGADAETLIVASVDAIWNRRHIGEVVRYYAADYREWCADGRVLFGREELQADVVSLMGAFPDLRLYIDDLFWEDDSHGGCQSCLRWTLLGTNTGSSTYGPPTGNGLRLSGLTAHRIRGGRLVEGWTAYSELGLARRLMHVIPPEPPDRMA